MKENKLSAYSQCYALLESVLDSLFQSKSPSIKEGCPPKVFRRLGTANHVDRKKHHKK